MKYHNYIKKQLSQRQQQKCDITVVV